MENDDFLPEIPVDKKRQAYYRECIREFELLGYRDQFLREISEDLEAVERIQSDKPTSDQ